MARFSTAVFVTASVSSSDFLNHNEVLGNSAFDIVALKIVPSIVGGTSEAQVYERDTFLTADLLYSTNPFVATGFDPIQKDSGGVITEALRGFVAPYEDQDSTGEFHIKLINNDSQAKTYTITLIYEVVAATSVVNIDDLGDVTISGVASGEVLKWDGANWINNTLAEAGIAAASHVHSAADITTGLLAIARGGTNGATAGAGFDNLSPLTTLGDVIFRDASNNVRLTGNITTTKQFLSQTGDGAVSAAPVWSALVNADLPAAMEITTSLGIGGAVETSAGFELDSTTKAVLVSRMTTGERDALTDVDGFVIYNSTLGQMQGRISGAWVDMGQGGGTGDVSISGVPVNNQLAVWTNGTTIEGDVNLTWDASKLVIIGDVGIGGGTEASAGFELDSTTKAVLVSRMDTTQRNALTNVDGFILYNTTDSELQGRIGGAWVDLGAVGGGASAINDLSDVTITTVGTGELLKYDGADWINNTLVEAGIAAASHTHNASDIDDGVLVVARGGTALGTTPSNGELLIGDGVDYQLNTLTGTANEVAVANGAGSITLSLPSVVEITTSLGIGGSVETSAGFELDSTTKAVLVSRMSSAQRNSLTAVDGMIIYDNVTNQLEARISGVWQDLTAGGGGGNVNNTGTPLDNQLAIWTDVITVQGDSELTYDGNSFRCSGSGPHGFGTIPLSFIQFTFAGFFTSSGANNYTVGVLFNTDLTSAAGDIRADCARMGGAAGGSITTPGGGESLTIASLRIDEPNITIGGGDTVTIAATLFIMNAPDEGDDNYALFVETGQSRFGAVGTNDGHVHILSPSTSIRALVLEVPISSTAAPLEIHYDGNESMTTSFEAALSQLNLTARNLGNDITGCQIGIHRNTSASTEGPAAGTLKIEEADGTDSFIWTDATGDLRIHSAPPTGSSGSPTISDLAGIEVGAQTSWYKLKENIKEFVDYQSSLDKVLETPLYSFDMKGRHFDAGYVIHANDTGKWYSWNDDLDKQQVPVLNDRNIYGYFAASIKALDNNVKSRDNEIVTLQNRIQELEEKLEDAANNN